MKKANFISLLAMSASLVFLGAGCAPATETINTAAPMVNPTSEQPSSNQLPNSEPAPVTTMPTNQPTATVPPNTNPAPTPAPKPTPTPTPAPAPKKVSATIAGFSFQPSSITVSVGDTITWTNNDGTPHTVTADDGSFNSGAISPGASFSHTFLSAGTFAYSCS